MADMKEKNATINEEEQAKTTPETPEKNEAAAEKKPGKIKEFFGKHKSKIKGGLAIAGAVGVGVVADRLGIKFGKSKNPDEPGDAPAAE